MDKSQHLERRYTKVSIIGRGTYGTVYKGIDTKTGQTVAIKVIDLEATEDDINDIMKEIITLRDCDSKYVTEYYHSFNIGPELWIVMEYLGGGSVQSFLDPKFKLGIDEQYIKIIIKEVVQGLAYLHGLKKIHRDIKAANILLSTEGNVKLADFGVVGQLTETMNKRMTTIGSPYWMAPEVIMRDAYDQSADIWSLGVTCIEMALGAPPFSNLPPYPAMVRITREEPTNIPESKFSEAFRDFIAHCLIKSVDDRPSAMELLKHEFFTDAGPTKDLVPLIVNYQKSMEQEPPIKVDDYRLSENKSDSDNFPIPNAADFNSIARSLKRRRREDLVRKSNISVEFTFGTVSTLDSFQNTPRPPVDENHGYLYDDEDEMDGKKMQEENTSPYNNETEEDELLGNYPLSDDFEDDNLYVDGNNDAFGTMVRTHPYPNNPASSSDAQDPQMGGHSQTVVVCNSQSFDDHSALLRNRKISNTNGNKDGNTQNTSIHDISINLNCAKIIPKGKKKKVTKFNIRCKRNSDTLPHQVSPMLARNPSIIAFSIGIQTEKKMVFHKETQTEVETVSNLVGIYKEMDDLFAVLEDGIEDESNLNNLRKLRSKVKELTHMKIRERKLSKIESNADNLLAAKERIRQIRERRKIQMEKMTQSIAEEQCSD